MMTTRTPKELEQKHEEAKMKAREK